MSSVWWLSSEGERHAGGSLPGVVIDAGVASLHPFRRVGAARIDERLLAERKDVHRDEAVLFEILFEGGFFRRLAGVEDFAVGLAVEDCA